MLGVKRNKVLPENEKKGYEGENVGYDALVNKK